MNVTHDVRHAWRGLRRSPVFTVVVIVTLALNIGASAAVLGTIDTMYFRKLPVPQPERIIAIYSGNKHDRPHSSGGTWSTLDNYLALRSRVNGVTGLASYSMANVYPGELLGGDFLWTALVSGNYFDVLGVRAQIGRTIRPDEEEPAGQHPVAVISDFIWRTRLNADPTVLGRTLVLGKTNFTIVGVAPPGFTGVHPEGRTNLWIPYTMRTEAVGTRANAPMQIIGRLAPGATLAGVQASVAGAERDLRDTYPATDSLLALRADIRDRLTTPELSAGALIWMSTVWVMIALLQLVACSNIASLMLGRAAARRRELGVRLCLGASRMRILRSSLTEAGMLAVLGGCGGLLVGRWLSGLIATMQFLSTSDPGLDMRVVAIVALVTMGTVLQFGLFPALDASRTDPVELIRGVSAARKRKGFDAAGILVLGQVTVSLLLLGNAAAFVQLFAHQASAESGFDVEHLLTVTVPPRSAQETHTDLVAGYDDAMARVRAVQGVRAVAAAKTAPLVSPWYDRIVIPGRAVRAEDREITSLTAVSPGYFDAIGASLVRGRDFTVRDVAAPGAPADAFDVAVINEAMARRYWPGEDPLGRQLGLAGSRSATIIGVVRDMHDVSTVRLAPRVYFPLLESKFESFTIVLRTSGDPSAMFAPVSKTLRASNAFGRPSLTSMAQIRDDALQLSRIGSLALSVCAGVALLLTAIGLYGTVTMWAVRRRPEIGIRLALGSPARNVHRLLLAEVARLIGAGGVLGLACAFGVVQVERGQIGPYLSLGALPVVASVGIFVVIGSIAAFVPSWRASRQAPADVLRST